MKFSKGDVVHANSDPRLYVVTVATRLCGLYNGPGYRVKPLHEVSAPFMFESRWYHPDQEPLVEETNLTLATRET